MEISVPVAVCDDDSSCEDFLMGFDRQGKVGIMI